MFGSTDGTETTVLELLREVLPADSAKMELLPEMLLQKDLAIDSLGLLTFAVRLGEEFEFDLNQFADRIGDTRTVNELIATAKYVIEQTRAA
jgi:acyl carrier protein